VKRRQELTGFAGTQAVGAKALLRLAQEIPEADRVRLSSAAVCRHEERNAGRFVFRHQFPEVRSCEEIH
jgi:hypothetical protein